MKTHTATRRQSSRPPRPVSGTHQKNSTAAPSAGRYSLTTDRLRASGAGPGDSVESFLDRLQYLHEGLIPGPRDLLIINELWASTETRDFIKQRGTRYYLSELGRRHLEALRGEEHITQIRCTSEDVRRAKVFQARANREENARLELKDVIRIWSDSLDWEAYVQLRALGVRMGLTLPDLLKRLAHGLQNAHPLDVDRLIVAINTCAHS